MIAKRGLPYRVLVAGSRNWLSPSVIYSQLNLRLLAHEPLLVIHGNNMNGADRMAESWAVGAKSAGSLVEVRHFDADWKRYRGYAGMKRNLEMIAEGADVCLAFIARCQKRDCLFNGVHGSHGASHCADAAEKAGIKTIRFEQR